MSAYPKNIWHHFSVHLYYLVHDAPIEQLQEKRTFLKTLLNFFFFFDKLYSRFMLSLVAKGNQSRRNI